MWVDLFQQSIIMDLSPGLHVGAFCYLQDTPVEILPIVPCLICTNLPIFIYWASAKSITGIPDSYAFLHFLAPFQDDGIRASKTQPHNNIFTLFHQGQPLLHPPLSLAMINLPQDHISWQTNPGTDDMLQDDIVMMQYDYSSPVGDMQLSSEDAPLQCNIDDIVEDIKRSRFSGAYTVSFPDSITYRRWWYGYNTTAGTAMDPPLSEWQRKDLVAAFGMDHMSDQLLPEEEEVAQ
ncbi:hypothetical protein V8D89_015965 [Ganoderma adspersum]